MIIANEMKTSIKIIICLFGFSLSTVAIAFAQVVKSGGKETSFVLSLIEYGFAAFGVVTLSLLAFYILRMQYKIIDKNTTALQENTNAVNELATKTESICNFRGYYGRGNTDFTA